MLQTENLLLKKEKGYKMTQRERDRVRAPDHHGNKSKLEPIGSKILQLDKVEHR